MSSEIRDLLSAAQSAEIVGDVPLAVRLLTRAAAWYSDHNMDTRAQQMLRHARRLRGEDIDDEVTAARGPMEGMTAGGQGALLDDALGFGRALLDDDDEDREVPVRRPTHDELPRASMFERGPARADPAIGAWCSFCCRPQAEVGALVAGPAGAYICAGCLGIAGGLLDVELPELTPVAIARELPTPPRVQLPAQVRARERLERRKPRVALLLGPEGAGKSELLRSMGPLTEGAPGPSGDTVLIDLSHPLSGDEEAKLLAWLDAHPVRRAVLAARGAVPQPVLVLSGEAGEEAVFDTKALHEAVGALLSPAVLSRVDAVVPMDAPDRPALEAFAVELLAARAVSLPDEAVEKLVDLAEASGRGAHELTALIARIPAGRWQAR